METRTRCTVFVLLLDMSTVNDQDVEVLRVVLVLSLVSYALNLMQALTAEIHSVRRQELAMPNVL